MIDLSEDGNSNSNISFKTIDYIKKLSLKEKNNLHVCIGWTESFRFLHYIDPIKKFENIIPQWLIKSKDGPWSEEKHTIMLTKYIGDYCRSIIQDKKDIDSFLTYFSDFLLLENFLIANNITYTFWRSMGFRISNSDLKNLNNFIDVYNLSNVKSWIHFNSEDTCPAWIEKSWDTHEESRSKSNHPSEQSVVNQKDRICQNIKNQLF